MSHQVGRDGSSDHGSPAAAGALTVHLRRRLPVAVQPVGRHTYRRAAAFSPRSPLKALPVLPPVRAVRSGLRPRQGAVLVGRGARRPHVTVLHAVVPFQLAGTRYQELDLISPLVVNAAAADHLAEVPHHGPRHLRQVAQVAPLAPGRRRRGGHGCLAGWRATWHTCSGSNSQLAR